MRVWLLLVLLLLASCGGSGSTAVEFSPTPTSLATRTPTLAPSASPTPIPPSATPTLLPTLEPLQVHADAQWIRDSQQRVVMLRGADYSGLEFGNFLDHPHGPRESDFAQMGTWGFNVIRLPIAWSYLEPSPNDFSDEYLVAQVDPVVDFAARHGIVVILEMHQFQWSPCFTNGNGAPAWVCDGRNYSDDERGQKRAACDFFTGALAPDGRSLMDHFVDVWRRVARHYAGDRRIAGFDFFNEPNPQGCIALGVFEKTVMNPFYRRLLAAVRDEGAEQTFFYEPPVTRNASLPATTEPMGPDVVYAPHLYTQTWGRPNVKYNGDASTITADYDLAETEAATLGGPLFVAEYGGNTELANGFRDATAAFLRDSLAEQNRRLVGSAVWAYFPSDNTFSVVDAEGQEKGDLVDILAQPYARRIAGIPTRMEFDSASGEFVFDFRNDSGIDPADPTEIFVPAERHYPGGFTVEVSAGDRVEFDATSDSLRIYRGSASEHHVRILPK